MDIRISEFLGIWIDGIWIFFNNLDFAPSDSDDSDYDYDNPKPLKNKNMYYTYTFDKLFKLILQYCPDSYIPKIRKITSYGILTSENYLMALLINRQDAIAADKRFIKHYGHDLNEQLFRFAIRNQNEQFLKFALSQSLLGAELFLENEVRAEILE